MHTVLSRDGTRIAVEAGGVGPALVVVNGALADRSAAVALRPHLEAHFTLVAYDRRGRGDSGDTAEYAPEREVEDLAEVIEDVGPPAFVYGHSSGGIIALNAAFAGVPIARLAVNEPPFILPGARPFPATDLAARIAAQVAEGDREGAWRLFLLESVGLPETTLTRLRSSPGWPDSLALAHTTPYDVAIAGSCELPRAALAALSVPTLVVSGSASFPWIIATAREVARTLPNVEFAVLEAQTHSPAPDVLAGALRPFFAP